ncbi:hypothetical protein AZE42_13617 [Rhizopogon vesiculosus]|uniref:Uncharacterized protein n=1 Tax=Rhizopogon vesiculosus TaxID=180088 RepID=A0A1J8PLE3_9AGAM|nr:hypothetical protein AZE42_13617 [Rhizopogon vesiculosus]
MPSFLNEANLQAIKQAYINNNQYYDLFTRLRTLFLPHPISLTDETLQVMAQKIHEVGCKLISGKAPSKMTPSKNDVLVQSLLETQRVTHVLLSALIEVTGVTESDTNTAIAMTVTSTLVAEVCAKQS